MRHFHEDVLIDREFELLLEACSEISGESLDGNNLLGEYYAA